MIHSLYFSFLFTITLLIDWAVASNWPYWTYESTAFRPPKLNITTAGEAPEPGLIFLGPRGDQPNGTAALIYDQAGNLVYQGPTEETSNVNVQTLYGKPVLTYWSGDVLEVGFGYGRVHILDDTYKQIYTVSLEGNFVTTTGTAPGSYNDLHESKITDRNTMLVTAYNVTQANLTAVGGPEDGWMLKGHFFEIDIATNQILFSWSTSDHADRIPITMSHNPLAGKGQNQTHPWDPYHINSIEVVDDGYLISLRHLFSVFYLNPNGTIKWQLAGDTGADFALGPNCNFSWQHHARVHNESSTNLIVSIFNNNNANVNVKIAPTTGLVLDVNLVNKTVTNLRTLADASSPIYAVSQGDMQLLDGTTTGHVFMSYGAIGVLREYDSAGNTIMSGQFGPYNAVSSYRGFKYDWHATPFWGPAIHALRHANESIDLFMSWNGATDYDSWAIYGGPSELLANATLIKMVERTGFETNVTLSLPLGMANVSHVQAMPRQGGVNMQASGVVALLT